MKKKITNMNITLNTEGIKKLSKESTSYKQIENGAKAMIKESILANSNETTITLHFKDKKLGNWIYAGLIRQSVLK
jgi:hypothetical protein